MKNTIHQIDIQNYLPDIAALPEAAHQELISFYEFLIFKYKYQEATQFTQAKDDKKRILSKIFNEASGKLPIDYTFNREELYER